MIPWNYSNIHWVLVFVDIERLQFSVLDSLSNRNPEINIEQQMMNVLAFLCELCNYEHKEVTDWKRINWKDFTWIHENGWLPKQTNSYDCGIFMLMNIYVIFKEKKCLYSQNDASTFRKYLFSLIGNVVYNEQKEIMQYKENIMTTQGKNNHLQKDNDIMLCEEQQSKLESSTTDERQQGLVADKKDENVENETNNKEDTNDIDSTKDDGEICPLGDKKILLSRN